jgi:hypothetical protein
MLGQVWIMASARFRCLKTQDFLPWINESKKRTAHSVLAK